MKTPPVIVVQLVHIEGPLKGEIQEFSEQLVSVGRQPSCHVQFPKELTIVSRAHAEIVREGNQFKLIDRSTNGTLVNGKRVKEVLLKDGDVLTFAEGGPKVSFLTQMMEGQPEIERPREPSPSPEMPSVPPPSPPQQPAASLEEEPPVAYSQVQAEPDYVQQIPVQRIQVLLSVQYGPTLRSFKELPVTFGKNPACDFVLDHPAILDRHAQVFFGQDQYWVEDLTGKQMLSINGRPTDVQAVLSPGDTLQFSPQGPKFRFLGGGRLAEVEEPISETPAEVSRERDTEAKPAKGIFKKFLRR